MIIHYFRTGPILSFFGSKSITWNGTEPTQRGCRHTLPYEIDLEESVRASARGGTDGTERIFVHYYELQISTPGCRKPQLLY